MGFDKLSASLGGISVLQRTVNAFIAADMVAEILIVTSQERWESLSLKAAAVPVLRVDGGRSRQDSVAAGLAKARMNFVAIHDGARPMILPEEIDRVVNHAVTHKAVALARRVSETLQRCDLDGIVVEGVNRENLWSMETPQVFETTLLREAYQRVIATGIVVTDEVTAFQGSGIPVRILESLKPNLKITQPSDLSLAEALLR